MSVTVAVGLLTILGGFLTLQTSAFIFGKPRVEVEISPPEINNENITYVQDCKGHMYKVDINEVKNVSSPDFSVENDVFFELYTPENPTEPQILTLNNFDAIFESHFVRSRKTKMFIHGWNSEGAHWPKFTDTYLVKGKLNMNLIAVNWRKGADTYFYHFARRRVNEVGEHVARFVDKLNERALMGFEYLNLIGHSLGAHISGIVGKNVKRGKISKIIALDPASPLFKYEDVKNRLDETDAHYVEVIHTSTSTLGIARQIGHAHFHPNGGKAQPGCGWDMTGACAHSRAVDIYFESVYSSKFFAIECGSLENVQTAQCLIIGKVVRMGGEPGHKYLKGVFYLETNDQPPYAQGRMGLLRTIKKTSKAKSMLSSMWNYIRGSTHVHDRHLDLDIEESIVGL